jgi:hypothetical protein
MDKYFVHQNSNTQALLQNLICLRKAMLVRVWVSAVVLLVVEKGIIRNQEKKRLFEMHHSETSNISCFVPDQPSTFLTQSLTLPTLKTLNENWR